MIKKKFMLAIAVVLCTIALVAGGTFALFTDSANSVDATYTAGTLSITSERNDGDRVPGPMFYVTGDQGATPSGLPGIYPTGVWAPGDSFTRTLTVYNPEGSSTMDAWLTSVEASLQAGSYADMADKLWVEIITPQNGSEVKVGEGWLSQFLAAPIPIIYPNGDKIPVYLSSNRHMKFKVTFDRSAGNVYQDKTLIVDFTVNAEQMPNNP